MNFIKENIKYIILIVVCSVGAFTYVYFSKSHLISSGVVNSANKYSGNLGDTSLSCMNNYTSYMTRLNTVKNNYLNNLYPVGSIYISMEDSTAAMVQNKLGGTWEAFGAGSTLVGYQSSDTDYDQVLETGGAKTHTIATNNLPAHSHTYSKVNSNTGEYALTIANLPAHTHKLMHMKVGSNGSGSSHLAFKSNSELILYDSNGAVLWRTGVTYTDQTNDIYHAITIGKGSITSEARGSNTAHKHAIKTTSTNTGTTGGGVALNTMDKYIVVYMWRRTA